MQRTVAAWSSAPTGGGAIRSGMPPGGMKAGSSTSTAGPPAGSGGGGEEQLVEVAALPLAQALLEEPQPADVAEEPGAAVDAELVGEVGEPGGLGEDRGVELEADERPRATGDVGEPLGGRRDADDRRRGVVGADGRARVRPPAVVSADDPGGLDRWKQRRRDPEPVEQLGGPLLGAGVEQPGGRRVRQPRCAARR